MAHKDSIVRYRAWYARLLLLHPPQYHERFGHEMEQVFADILLDRALENRSILASALWMCIETSAGIINENIKHIVMKKRIAVLVALVAAILLIPLIAMQFSDEVVWTALDFVFAGGLLLGAGLAYEFISSRSTSFAYRTAAGLVALTSLLLIWITAAVGVIGDENPGNLLYAGVILILIVGSVLTGFRTQGMSKVLFVTAAAQMLVPTIAVIFWPLDFAPGIVPVFILNACFATLWIGSALLFRKAIAQA